jgi:hypothetical protein
MKKVIIGVKDASVGALGPIDQPPIDPALGDALARSRIKPPFLNTGGGIEREEFEVGRRAINHPINHQRIALDLRTVLRV